MLTEHSNKLVVSLNIHITLYTFHGESNGSAMTSLGQFLWSGFKAAGTKLFSLGTATVLGYEMGKTFNSEKVVEKTYNTTIVKEEEDNNSEVYLIILVIFAFLATLAICLKVCLKTQQVLNNNIELKEIRVKNEQKSKRDAKIDIDA